MRLYLILIALVVAQDTQDEQAEEAQPDLDRQIREQTQYACVILTKYQMQKNSEHILSMMKSYTDKSDQMHVYHKLQAQHVIACLGKLNPQRLMDLFSELKAKQFDIEKYADIFMMLELSYDLEDLTETEHAIVEYIKGFDKQVQDQRRNDNDNDDEDEEVAPQNRRQAQQSFKLFGFDLASLTKSQQLIVLAVILLSLGVGLIYGLNKVTKSTGGPLAQRKPKKVKKQ